MAWYANLKISSKLLIGFVIVALISAIVGGVGLYNIKSANDAFTYVTQNNLAPMGPLVNMQANLDATRVNLRNMMLDEQNKEKYIENIKKSEQEVAKGIVEYGKMVDTDEERALYSDLKMNVDKYMVARDKVLDLSRNGQREQAIAVLRTEGMAPAAAAIEDVKQLFAFNYKQAEKQAQQNEAAAARSMIVMVSIILLAMLGAIGLGLLIARSISKPVGRIVDAAERIAVGDLNININLDTQDEIGMLARSFDKIILSLRGLVADVDLLVDAAVNGKLSERADAAKHTGEYRDIVDGVNRTLDAVIGPLDMAANCIDSISKGNMPPKIAATYNGDFNILKMNINNCIDNIHAMIADINVLVQAALKGDLAKRADVSGHCGDYRKIIEGVNQTLDAVIEPIREASVVLQEMTEGNLSRRVEGNYKGDHAEIKRAMNSTLDALDAYIEEISSVLTEMAHANLNVGINNQYKGDFAQIKDALNLIINVFNETFTDINQSADEVASGSKQVSDGSQALSQGTTEQASATEQLTVSVGQIAAQTRDNAVNANQASDLAHAMKGNAEQGSRHMEEMLRAMAEINDSSGNISKIIKVIDEIAFQTNILALNAAVEAARAGQHGKGFAVVAEEVRNLAARSANAAKDTTMLIEGSIKKVEDGTEIANATARALGEIVGGVTKASQLVGQIAAASNEQASAIAQINKGVEQVSQVVQNNSATAEQSAAASEELSAQAERLKEMVGRFRLKQQAGYLSRTEAVGPSVRENKKYYQQAAFVEAAATSSKPKIALSDREFGKY